MTLLPSHSRQAAGPISREFVAMMAAIMALNALAIDSMLPALPDIAQSLAVHAPNERQYVVSLYFVGLGAGSLLHGPLADRFGRKPILMTALVGYVLCALLSGLSQSWHTLLMMRVLHGLFGAAMGVVATAIVRDRTSGDAMARMMSMIFLVFMIVPIIAPSMGQLILSFASWRWTFLALAIIASGVALWVAMRFAETLAPENRQAINIPQLRRAWGEVVKHRQATAYMIGGSLAMGANYGFLNSGQQIIADAFDARALFPYAFACAAAGMAVANFSNSRIVEKFGARRVSHAAVLGWITITGIHWICASLGEPLWLFVVLIAMTMGMTGFIGSNFSSIAMEPFGRIAGSASSFQNASRTLISAVVGGVIGAGFNGTSMPLARGTFLCGVVALIMVLIAERGKLFQRPNPPHRPLPEV